jgi:hypothetical protein
MQSMEIQLNKSSPWLTQHLNNNDFQLTMFIGDYFMTILLQSIELEKTTKIIDLFLIFGEIFLFTIIEEMFILNKEEIL